MEKITTTANTILAPRIMAKTDSISFCLCQEARLRTRLEPAARAKLGDEDWMRCFRTFVTLFNNFVESLNDGKFDTAILQRMRIAWTRLEAD